LGAQSGCVAIWWIFGFPESEAFRLWVSCRRDN